jgi:hypothetical protein
MKIYLKKLGKFLFWNFLSAAILGSFFSLMVWASRLSDAQRKVQGAVENRSAFSELEQAFTREVSLVEISLDILIIGILLGIIVLGVLCYIRPSKIWYKHPDKKQKVLLVSSDLIVGVGCWIVVLCYWSQYIAILPWLYGFLLVVLLLCLFVGKFLCSFDE